MVGRGHLRAASLAILAAVAASLGLGVAEPGRAMPLFTRATGEPCVQCHLGFSRLRPYAVAFLEHGYREPASLAPQTSATRVPVSVVGRLGDELTSRPGRMRELSVIAAAPLEAPGSHPLSALAEAAVDSTHVRVDRAWLELDGIGSWTHGALKAGEFDAELPFLSARRRTTLTPYLAPIAIDARGVEIRQGDASGAIGAGLIESHRSGSAPERLQDTYLWARRSRGGSEFAARVWFDRQDSNLPQLSWLQHLQYLATARLALRGVEVVPAYLQDRFDDQPVLKNHDKRHSFLLETFVPLDRDGRWSTTARYERLSRTRTPLTPEENEWLGVVGLAYRMNPDAQFAVEWNDRGNRLGDEGTRLLNAWVRVAF